MKYKKIAITAVLIIMLIIMIIGYFGFASLSSSFGYNKGANKEAVTDLVYPNTVTVMVDAGHGGGDPGAVANALVEKDINLSVAFKLKELLKASGVRTVMTREDDALLGTGNTVRERKTADLKARLQLLNSTDNCIFVSIHMNKFEQSYVHGLQTFYASASPLAQELAKSIQDSVKLIDSENNRQIKPDGNDIYILENTDKTAVLVECGFLSNPNDATLLADEEYQKKVAFIIYCGIMKFIQENQNENTVYMY